MTTLDQPAPITTWLARDWPTVLLDQLGALEGWAAARAEITATVPGSRESRLDQARREDALARADQALLDRAALHLRHGEQFAAASPRGRVVVAHRNAWFTSAVRMGLHERGLEPIAALDNGADTVGVCVAEQPDVLFIEDRLPSWSGREVISHVRRFAPHTLIAVQSPDPWTMGELLDCGAHQVFDRAVPPAEVAARLAELIGV